MLMYVNVMHVHVHIHVCVLTQPGRDTRLRLCLCTRTYKPGLQWEPAQVCVGKGRGALWGPRGAGSRRPGNAPAGARGSVLPETSEARLCSSPAQTFVTPRPQLKAGGTSFLLSAFVGLSVASPETWSGGVSLCALGRLRPQADHHSAACPQPAQASVGGVGRALVSAAPALAVRESPWEPPPPASSHVSAAGARGSSCVSSLQPARRTFGGRARETRPPRAGLVGVLTRICSVGAEVSSATQGARTGAGGSRVSCLQQSAGDVA